MKQIQNKQEALDAVQQDPWNFALLSPQYQDDLDVVMAAVEGEGTMLEHASAQMKANRDVVMAAVKQDGWAFAQASNELKDDVDVVMAMLHSDSRQFPEVSTRLREDPRVVITAIRSNPLLLEHADALLQTSTVMQYIAEHGIAIPYPKWPRVRDSLLENLEILQDAPVGSVQAWVDSVCTAPVTRVALPHLDVQM